MKTPSNTKCNCKCKEEGGIYYVTKETTFDMAHRLSKHKGPCSNLHGHTYKLQATFASTTLMDGMAIDFGELGQFLNKATCRYDHKTVLDGNSAADLEIGEVLRKLGLEYMYMTKEPTAENMAMDFLEFLDHDVQRYTDKRVYCASVKLWETPTSFVEVML